MQNVKIEGEVIYYNNFIDAVRKIAKYEGLTAFWKGFTSRIVYAAPNSALIMALCKWFGCFSLTIYSVEYFKYQFANMTN